MQSPKSETWPTSSALPLHRPRSELILMRPTLLFAWSLMSFKPHHLKPRLLLKETTQNLRASSSLSLPSLFSTPCHLLEMVSTCGASELHSIAATVISPHHSLSLPEHLLPRSSPSLLLNLKTQFWQHHHQKAFCDFQVCLLGTTVAFSTLLYYYCCLWLWASYALFLFPKYLAEHSNALDKHAE